MKKEEKTAIEFIYELRRKGYTFGDIQNVIRYANEKLTDLKKVKR